jgi:hypothetical protein
MCLLDASGAPLVGANNSYVSGSLITVSVGLEYEAGQEVTEKNGAGVTCLSYKTPDTLKRGTITNFQWCTPDPNVMTFLIGGNAIVAGTNEVQTVTITGTPTGGTFTLTFAAQTTTPIAFNATAATVRAALEALSSLDVGDITVTGSAGGPWTVTFNPALGNVPAMTADGTGLTGGTTPTVVVATTTQGVAGDQTGYRAPQVGVASNPNGVGLEFWTRAIINGAFASNLPFMHWVVPRAFLSIDGTFDLSGTAALKPQFTGFCTQNAAFGDGPNNDILFPTDRVWQWNREATTPNLSAPGFQPVLT